MTRCVSRNADHAAVLLALGVLAATSAAAPTLNGCRLDDALISPARSFPQTEVFTAR